METVTVRNIKIGEGAPKIIVPLVGKNREELLDEAVLVQSAGPDLIEWRADFFDKVENIAEVTDMAKQLRSKLGNIPLIFTFRTRKEGGEREIGQDYYRELNLAAIHSGSFDLIDLELFSPEQTIDAVIREAKKHAVYVIMSNHEFSFTPPKEEIMERLQRMEANGADLLKIAVMPQSVSDVLTLLDATTAYKQLDGKKPLVTMAMGGLGLISRMAGEVFGSAMTFASGKSASAPGQIPVSELKSVIGILHRNLQ